MTVARHDISEAQPSQRAAWRAGTVVLSAVVVGLLAGIASATATVIVPELRGGEDPCLREGFRVADCVSAGETAAYSLLNFSIASVGVFAIIVLLALLAGVAWRLLKWALSG